MNADNFNGLSCRDIELGNQINQVLKEYDLISKKITESKRNIIPGLTKLNTCTIRTYNLVFIRTSDS